MSSITFFLKKSALREICDEKENILQKISWYVKCFRITMFGWWFAWSGYGTQKCKKTFFIFLETATDELHYWLITTHVENKFCIEKGRVIVTKDDRLSH